MCTSASTRGHEKTLHLPPPPPPTSPTLRKVQLEMSAILGAIFQLIIFNPYGRAFFELGENLVQIEKLENC